MLPKYFQTTSKMQPSYSYTDMIQGLGYKRFYGACSVINAGSASTYALVTQTVESTATTTGGVATLTTGATLDVDFDIEFAVPAIVGGGNAFVNCTTVASANNAAACVMANIIHVRGSTETVLASGSGVARNYTAGTANFRDLLILDMTSKKFAIGDKLRLTMYVFCDTGSETVYLYHDPSSAITFTETGLGSRTIGSDLTVDVPFKLDL